MRVPFTVYDPATGKIIRSGSCAAKDVPLQYDPETEALLEAESDPVRDEVKGGRVQSIPRSLEDEEKERLALARRKRNTLLAASDWTQVEDAPLTRPEKAQWAAYRQALRNVPDEIDAPGFTWPEPPGTSREVR